MGIGGLESKTNKSLTADIMMKNHEAARKIGRLLSDVEEVVISVAYIPDIHAAKRRFRSSSSNSVVLKKNHAVFHDQLSIKIIFGNEIFSNFTPRITFPTPRRLIPSMKG